MIAVVLEFSRYFVVLLFGSAVAVSFAGMERTRKNYLAFGCFAVLVFIVQLSCLRIWGMEVTLKLYPLTTHLSVVVFIVLYLKCPWLASLTSMLVSFLCCKPPHWIGTVAGEVFGSTAMNHIGYIAAAFLMYWFLQKYVAASARQLMKRSVKSCLLFGVVPSFYYLFDFIATVYTDFMYSREQAAAQFIPTVMTAFYFVFVVLYYAETQKQATIQRERDMLDTQFKQA